MLYIASALTPTPISHTVKVANLTDAETSLVVAKPDRVEVWDLTAQGLEFRSEIRTWGSVIGLAAVVVPDTRPHLLVLSAPPNARIHLVAFEDDKLVITASEALAPPTPLLRRQEFFTGVIAAGSSALVSIWTGLVSYLEMEPEKVKDMKRRKGTGRRLVFKHGATFNVNIREHNLLDITFLPGDPDVILVLWLSENNKICIQPRLLNGATHSFTDLAADTDVVNPLDYPLTRGEEVDFELLPFSCPAGRNLLSVGKGPGNTRLFLVVGDEHTVLYSVTTAEKASTPTSTRANAHARRSPQAETTGGIGKKRKSSASGRSVATDTVEHQAHIRPVWRARQGFGTVLGSSVIENHTSGGSILLGDECGRLTAIGWEFDGAESVRVGKIDLGAVSPPTALTYLDNGHVFISSACGDSLLVTLDLPADDSPKGKGKARSHAQESADAGAWSIALEPDVQRDVALRERWMNIAPVKDFVVVEEEDGRMAHLVVASGAGNTNSLRIVQSGVGFDDVLTVEGISGVERMWTLSDGSDHPTLLLSFWDTTAILHLEPDAAPVAVSEQVSSVSTLAAGLVGGILAQVTPYSVQLWSDLVAGVSVGTYRATEAEIVAASVKGSHIVAALRDGSVVVWKAGGSLEQLSAFKLAREAVTVDISADGALIAVSDWSGSVQLFDAAGVAVYTTTEQAYAASLLFMPGQLLAGLSDGTCVTYDLGTKARTQSSLGSRPLNLVPVEVACSDEVVFAAGISERLSLVFESRGHTEVSASGKKGVVAAASVSTEALGSCLVLATSQGLCFSRLTSLKTLHVQTLDLGSKSATRVATVPDMKLLAVGTVTQTLAQDTGDVLQVSGVEIRDSTTLKLLADYKLPSREAITSVNSALVDGKRYVAVGTAVFTSDDAAEEARLDELSSFIQADKGRFVLLEPELQDDATWTLKKVTSLDTTAPVLDSVTIHNFIAIATPAKVSILLLDTEIDPDAGPILLETAKCTFAFEAHFLAVSRSPDGDNLVVGDAMRSILVLDIDRDDGSVKWDQRDMSSHAVRALAEVRDDGPGALIADDYSNLLTFRLKTDIEPAASFGLHEDVARFRPGAFASTAPEVLRPDLVFATAAGRLGIIGELGASATRTLDDLQRNMNKTQIGPGGVTWRAFRRGGSLTVPKDTLGFVDGDYLQTFLALDADDAESTIKGVSTHEHVCRIENKAKVPADRGQVVRLLETVAGMH